MRQVIIRNGKPIEVNISNKFLRRFKKEADMSPESFIKWHDNLPNNQKTLLKELGNADAQGYNIDPNNIKMHIKQLNKEYEESFGKGGVVGVLKVKDENGNWKTDKIIGSKGDV